MLRCRLHSNITTYQQHASRIVLCEVPRAVGVCNTSSNIRVFGALLRTSGLEFQGRADCAWLFEPNGMVEMVIMGSASHLTRHVFNFLIVLACSLNSFWWLEPIEFRNSLAHQISSSIKSSQWPMHSQLWALPCLMMPEGHAPKITLNLAVFLQISPSGAGAFPCKSSFSILGWLFIKLH